MSKHNNKQNKKLQNKKVSEGLSKEEILSRLFQETEAPIQKITTDSHLDQINEIRKALSLEPLDSIESKYIAKDRNVYKVRFIKPYYVQLYKFIGITVTEENEKKLMRNKPKIFARKTLEIVYNRFPRGTVDLLRRKNIRINGVYLFKHHECFTPIGLQELEDYINDAIRLMQESTYWFQFLRKLARLNNRPYQLDFFDND